MREHTLNWDRQDFLSIGGERNSLTDKDGTLIARLATARRARVAIPMACSIARGEGAGTSNRRIDRVSRVISVLGFRLEHLTNDFLADGRRHVIEVGLLTSPTGALGGATTPHFFSTRCTKLIEVLLGLSFDGRLIFAGADGVGVLRRAKTMTRLAGEKITNDTR